MTCPLNEPVASKERTPGIVTCQSLRCAALSGQATSAQAASWSGGLVLQWSSIAAPLAGCSLKTILPLLSLSEICSGVTIWREFDRLRSKGHRRLRELHAPQLGRPLHTIGQRRSGAPIGSDEGNFGVSTRQPAPRGA